MRITHHEEIFEAVGRVVYVSLGLGMGVVFETISDEQFTGWCAGWTLPKKSTNCNLSQHAAFETYAS